MRSDGSTTTSIGVTALGETPCNSDHTASAGHCKTPIPKPNDAATAGNVFTSVNPTATVAHVVAHRA